MNIEEIQDRLKAPDAVRLASQDTGISWCVIADIKNGINQNPTTRTLMKLKEYFNDQDR